MSNVLSEWAVRDYMSRDLVLLHADATVHDALKAFVGNRVSAVPLVNSMDQCVAIITATDIIEITYDIDDDFTHANTVNAMGRDQLVARLSESVGSEPAISYATESVTSVKSDATIGRAAKIMAREQIHHLPVESDDGTLAGLLSTMDIIAAVADSDD